MKKVEDKVYHEILDHAACLMAIAQRLYKSHLSEEDYQQILKVAVETEVEPYDIKKGTLH